MCQGPIKSIGGRRRLRRRRIIQRSYPMQKEQLVLVGNGMAGMRTLEELLAIAPERYQITVFGAEPHGNYNRILLSPVLAGEKTVDQIMINDLNWYAERDIRLHAGRAAVSYTHLDVYKRQDGCGWAAIHWRRVWPSRYSRM